ncbi:unnamed protein product [Calypogeia fissa]
MSEAHIDGETKTTKMRTDHHDESADVATLKSMLADANEELGRKLGRKGLSPAAKRWQHTATLLRTVRAFNYLKEEPTDEAVAEVQTKSLSFKSQSSEGHEPEEDGVENLLLVEEETGEVEKEDDEPLKPLAMKFRLAGMFISKMQPLVFRNDGTMDRTIHEYIDIRVKANKTPVDGIYTTDVHIDPDESELWVRIFAHLSTDEKLPVVLYFHGGGFAEFHADSTSYDQLGRKIAKALNAVVVSVNYRQSPEHRYPTQYEDCFKALQWLQKTQAGSNGLPETADLSRTILAGDSAGGNITHHVGVRAAESDLGPVKIRAWIMLQPFFGAVERSKSELRVPNPFLLSVRMSDWFWKAFLPLDADRDHKAANVVGPNAPDLKGLGPRMPPIFIVIGTHDILKDREVEYGKMMATVVGKEKVLIKKYDYGFHGFFAFDLVLQKSLMLDMQSFVENVLPKSNP